ncbi:MAG TPA: KTSC domain-containing protein [Rhizomicrobium sp.]|jgi:hypothetical protein
MPIVDSGALVAVDYDEERKVLRVTFRGSNKTYDYLGVPPADYAALMASASRGAWFNNHIRDRYRFERVRGPVRVL